MRRFIILTVMAVVLLTGCSKGQTENEAADKNIGTTTAGDASIGEDTTGGQGAQTGQNSTANSENTTETETEPYVVVFEADTVDGEAITSDCFAQSKLTMLNVWATYCNPCLNEMPDLGEIAASYDTADFQMYGIISDVVEGATADEIALAKDLIEQTKADYPHMILNQSLYNSLVLAVEAVPTTFFVNQKGELLGYVIGAQSKETWEELINELLEEAE